MKKIYIFRHGETNWNKDTTLKYSEKVHNVFLNEKGMEQAKQNALNLKDKGIEYVYTSKLKRAKQTGEILAKSLNVGTEIVDGLEEWSIYDETCIGFTIKEIKEKVGYEKVKSWREERDTLMDWKPYKCETKREARKRIHDTIFNICRTTPYNIIAIASHGNALREFLRSIDYEDDSRLNNCEIIETEFDGENIKIIKRIKQ